ncbi:MAG: hypothetical protein AAGH78_13295 [Cyanobacteria bacterium P01_H01_bin.58]
MFEYSLQRYKPLPQETLELLELHQLAQSFRLEQDYREAHEAYCRHYRHLVQQHREDHAVMQNELNVFAVFWKKRDHS